MKIACACNTAFPLHPFDGFESVVISFLVVANIFHHAVLETSISGACRKTQSLLAEQRCDCCRRKIYEDHTKKRWVDMIERLPHFIPCMLLLEQGALSRGTDQHADTLLTL